MQDLLLLLEVVIPLMVIPILAWVSDMDIVDGDITVPFHIFKHIVNQTLCTVAVVNAVIISLQVQSLDLLFITTATIMGGQMDILTVVIPFS